MCSPRDIGWSVVEGEGVAEEIGRVSADVEPPLEVMDRLNLESMSMTMQLRRDYYISLVTF